MWVHPTSPRSQRAVFLIPRRSGFRVEMHPEYPIIDSVQLYRVGSRREHGFAGVC